jgi:hypothetical protein
MKKLIACVVVVLCIAMLLLAVQAWRNDSMDVVAAGVILIALIGAPLIIWDARHRTHAKVSGSS